jgi:hypothetical protein
MTNDIVRTRALNCFEELTSTNKQLNNIIGLSLNAKTFFLPMRFFKLMLQELFLKVALLIAFACK